MERVKEKNEKTLDNLHKRLCFLTQDKDKILGTITTQNCVDLYKHKQTIIDNDIIGTHLAAFGRFDIK